MRRLGKYLLLEPIASGGMAEVWRAEVAGPAGFVKQVAVKLVRADRRDDDEMVRMFVQEARLASRLHHAGIVHVFDLDEVDGRYVIAMELVHGRSLREVLDRCREANVRFGLPRAVNVAAQVARALAYAHRPVDEGGVAGLVHRDVSPHNVLVSFEGEVKLTDFGIARAPDAGGLTGPGTMKGKVGYMAPEQAGSGPVDARADVFALGVVLWELCTGRRLFARESEVATLRLLVGDDPISPPSFWNDLVPPALDAIVLEALARDPARRLPAAEEMARRLSEVDHALARTPEERELRPLMRRLWPKEFPSRPTPPPSPPGEGRGAAPRSAEETTRTWPPRRRGTAFAGFAAAVAAVAGWLWLAARAPEVQAGSGDAGPRDAGRRDAGEPGASPSARPVTASDAAEAAPAPSPPPLAPVARVAQPAQAAERPPPASSRTPGPAAPRDALRDAPPSAGDPTARPALGRRQASAAPVRPTPSRGVLAAADALEGLEVPPAESGEGILFVNTSPWAEVLLDGAPAGYTPRELRLQAGSHRLRLSHPSRGTFEQDVEVRPGERVRVEPPLAR